MTESMGQAGAGVSSVVVDRCQICSAFDLESVLFLGYLPPVNDMRPIGERPQEQPAYPAELLYCPRCHLVQLGLIVDPSRLFPPEYPYTSGTTRILRENFAQLYEESQTLVALTTADLIVDVGSNDGTLLSNFKKGGIEYRASSLRKWGIWRSSGVSPLLSPFSGMISPRKCDASRGRRRSSPQRTSLPTSRISMKSWTVS